RPLRAAPRPPLAGGRVLPLGTRLGGGLPLHASARQAPRGPGQGQLRRRGDRTAAAAAADAPPLPHLPGAGAASALAALPALPLRAGGGAGDAAGRLDVQPRPLVLRRPTPAIARRLRPAGDGAARALLARRAR